MPAVDVKVLTGRTSAGEFLEITLYQPPGEVVLVPACNGLEPVTNAPAPIAVQGWFVQGGKRHDFEAWLIGEGTYLNPKTNQRGATYRAVLPWPAAHGTW